MRIVIAGILGGLVMWLWGAVSHMATPLGQMGMKVAPVAVQDQVLAATKGFDGGAAVYMLPMMEMAEFSDEAKKNAFVQRQTSNPYAFVVWAPNGVDSVNNMGGYLVTQWITDTLSAMLLAFIVSFAAVGFGTRVLLFGAGGLFATMTLAVPYWNWYRFPLEFTIAAGVMQVVGWLLAGAAMAWWLGRRR